MPNPILYFSWETVTYRPVCGEPNISEHLCFVGKVENRYLQAGLRPVHGSGHLAMSAVHGSEIPVHGSEIDVESCAQVGD